MPTTAFFYLPKDTDKAQLQRLDGLVDKITNTVPAHLWHGVSIWSGLSSEPNFDATMFKRNTDDRIRRHATLRGQK
jgi:hypothetical protein